MVLLDRVEMLNLPRLTHWLVERQMGVEGGFQGRTNKLVDGCYSFWRSGGREAASALPEVRAPSASLGRLKAQAAPTHPERRLSSLEACRGPNGPPRATAEVTRGEGFRLSPLVTASHR